MAINARPIGNVESPEQLTKIVKEVFQDLEDQLNRRAQLYVSSNGRAPSGLNNDDVLIITYKNRFSILIKQRNVFKELNASQLGGLLAHETNFVGLKTDNVAASTVHFPLENDWGFFERTGGSPGFFLVFNTSGGIKQVQLT